MEPGLLGAKKDDSQGTRGAASFLQVGAGGEAETIHTGQPTGFLK